MLLIFILHNADEDRNEFQIDPPIDKRRARKSRKALAVPQAPRCGILTCDIKLFHPALIMKGIHTGRRRHRT